MSANTSHPRPAAPFSRVNRRQLLTATAWAAPTVLIAVAVPTASASTNPSVTLAVQPLNQGYAFFIVTTRLDTDRPVSAAVTVLGRIGDDWVVLDAGTTDTNGDWRKTVLRRRTEVTEFRATADIDGHIYVSSTSPQLP